MHSSLERQERRGATHHALLRATRPAALPQDAAALRDRLKEARPPPPPLPLPPVAPKFDPTAPTTSDTVTEGIRVTCRSFYVPSESRPASSAYFFAYTISIKNEGKETVKLVER